VCRYRVGVCADVCIYCRDAGQYFVCVTGMALAGALLGFLPHNFKPASIFLGDAGSHLWVHVGGVAGDGDILPAGGANALPVLIPLLVLAVPLFDLVMVMWIRIRRGEPVYIGDRIIFLTGWWRTGTSAELGGYVDLFDHADDGAGRDGVAVVGYYRGVDHHVQSVCILAIVTLLEQLGGKS